MLAKKSLTTVALVCAMMVAVPLAQAQDTAAWQGQDSEFGKIRAPYGVDVNGERATIEAQVVLHHNYEEKDSRFFMFSFTVENHPSLDITFDHLIRTDTNEELPCYQREGTENSALKCFVDLKFMPPEGTEIKMAGTIGSDRAGTFQVGAMVVPFTYTWSRVQMSNGLNAELYAGTMVNVHQVTSGTSGAIGGSGNFVPGVGTVGLLAAAGAAVVGLGVVQQRRKGRA